jgi:predicted RNA binding protein YcfA (HicA-like mRNA interferase family)
VHRRTRRDLPLLPLELGPKLGTLSEPSLQPAVMMTPVGDDVQVCHKQNWLVEITRGILGRAGRSSRADDLCVLMPMKVREVVATLERNGWALVRQRGSHRHFRHPNLPLVVTVAGKPNTMVPPGTLGSIRRTSGLEELR